MELNEENKKEKWNLRCRETGETKRKNWNEGQKGRARGSTKMSRTDVHRVLFCLINVNGNVKKISQIFKGL